MQVLVGERMCVITEVERSCGLVLYAVEPQWGEPFEQSLNPGGQKVWLALLLSILGHNLKGDQRAVPQSSKALFLPPHPSLSPLSVCPFSPFFYKPSYISLWNLDKNSTICARNTWNIYNILLAQKALCWWNSTSSDILVSNRFQIIFYMSKHRF